MRHGQREDIRAQELSRQRLEECRPKMRKAQEIRRGCYVGVESKVGRQRPTANKLVESLLKS